MTAGHIVSQYRLACLPAFLTLMTACAPVDVLNITAPRQGISIIRDVAYGTGARHMLDIYAPDRFGPDNGEPDNGATNVVSSRKRRGAPVVVFLYGGGWKAGTKSIYRFVGAELAHHGFATVIPDYRVYPDVRFPAFIQDAAWAIAWTRLNIADYGGDPERLFLMGHSAGAHIAAMLLLDRQWLSAVGMDPDRTIRAMAGLAGPYDFLPLHDPELDEIFSPAGNLRLTQPITFARGDAPPLLLLTGTSDTTVFPRNSEQLAARIRSLGGPVEVKEYKTIAHIGIIAALSRPLRWLAPTLQDVVAFFRKEYAATD